MLKNNFDSDVSIAPFLRSIGACSEAREWAEDRSLSECWAECEQADWLMWLVGRMADKPGWPTRKQVVLTACALAETVLPLVKAGEDRPRLAIKAARDWVRGDATLVRLKTAAYDAYAAYADSDSDSDANACSSAGAVAAYAAYNYAAYAYSAAADAAADGKVNHMKLCILIRSMLSIPETY